MMGFGLLAIAVIAAAAAMSSKKIEKLDPNVPDANAAAFNKALATERDPRELRAFAAAAIASGAPNYARAFIRKFLLLEGVPQPQVEEQITRHLQDPTLIQRPPRDNGTIIKDAAPAPGINVPVGPPPQGLTAEQELALLGAVPSVLATNNPLAMRTLAMQLRTPGNTQSAAVLQQRLSAAAQLEQRAVELEQGATSPGLPTAPVPGTQPPPPPAPASAMPAALRRMLDQALASGDVQSLGTAARILEDAGFPQEAAILRQKAGELAAKIPAPPPEEQPSRDLDPQMDPQLAADIAKQLALQGDPKILRELAVRVRALGFKDTADIIDAKAAQLETLIAAGDTLKDVEQIVKDGQQRSPGQPDVNVGPQPGGGVPILTEQQELALLGAVEATLATNNPVAMRTLAASLRQPGGVHVVQRRASAERLELRAAELEGAARNPGTSPAPSPSPQPPAPSPRQPARPNPLPQPKSAVEVAAENLQKHLLQLVAQFGMPGAKGKEDTFIVQKFQGADGHPNPDGIYGPGTALGTARFVGDIAPVFKWPKGSGTKAVTEYRNKLLALADDARRSGNATRADQLEASARRERGLGGVAGGPLKS